MLYFFPKLLADAYPLQLVMISSVFFAVGSILAAVANSFTLVYVQKAYRISRLSADFLALSGDLFRVLAVVESLPWEKS